jgi:ElaB/YqjD/DUF883 family membrane-anchored ribosome-binding protein
MSTMLNTATARAHGVVDQVAEAAAPAAKWVEEQSGAMTANGEKLLERATKFVADHPIQSLGLALAAGYLISRLTR